MKKLSNYAIIILAVLILVSISMPYKSFAEERIEINEPTEEYKRNQKPRNAQYKHCASEKVERN